MVKVVEVEIVLEEVESLTRGKGKYIITCCHCGVEGHKKSK